MFHLTFTKKQMIEVEVWCAWCGASLKKRCHIEFFNDKFQFYVEPCMNCIQNERNWTEGKIDDKEKQRILRNIEKRLWRFKQG